MSGLRARNRRAWLIEASAYRASQSEAAFTEAVRAFAEVHGWLAYHTHRSEHSPAGFPDLVMVRGARLVAAELKVKAAGTKAGDPTPAQIEWLEALRLVPGAIAEVWRPADWPRIESVLGGER